MYEAIAIVCFLTMNGPVCLPWSDEKNPYPSFEACDKATDRFLETIEARFAGMAVISARAGCRQLSDRQS